MFLRFLYGWWFAGLLLLAGCSDPATQSKLALACKVDGAVQPIAAGVLSALPVPGVSTGVTIDNLLVHPVVVAACAQIGGTPTEVAVAVAGAALASPVTASVAAHNPDATAVVEGTAAAVAVGVSAAH